MSGHGFELTEPQRDAFVDKLRRAARETLEGADAFAAGSQLVTPNPSHGAVMLFAAALAEVGAETRDAKLIGLAQFCFNDAMRALTEDVHATLADECDGADRDLAIAAYHAARQPAACTCNAGRLASEMHDNGCPAAESHE